MAGTTGPAALTDAGEVTIAVPRDRNGDFEPALVPRHARRLAGSDERILSLYARAG
ncbi:transposase [Embleya sp. NPDC020886]|uniref:transposase n=1 Tax=Embleya sp. NPDC020886 TaxID=3363980 RepID=UPI0037A1C325